jgi:aldehyde:ferredoxin oxidoreductase
LRYGYHERFLRIDLTKGRIDSFPPEDDLVEKWVGGRGFAAKMMWDLAVPKADPLAPENVFMFLTGPLTGMGAPCMRSMIAFKSPLTLTYSDSYHGGFFGSELKYAGYDGLVIYGRADSPVYLHVEDDQVEIRDATHLWGLDTEQLYHALEQEVGGSGRFEIACIGPAGENCVRYALVDTSYHRQSGRGGGGAVMGSKNLKAVVVRGTHRLPVANPQRFQAAAREAYATLADAPGAEDFRRFGTLSGIVDDSEKGILPTFNHQQASFEHAADLLGKVYEERIWLRNSSCIGCSISCGKMGAIRRGRYAGTISDNVEFETTGTMGSNLGFTKAENLQYASHMCDMLGLDTMSTGVTIAFATEAYKRGILSKADLDGIELDWDAANAIHKMIVKIAHREGIGDLLAEGVRRVSEKLGGEALEIAMHTKGLEAPGYETRAMPGHALGYATGDRGGDHERSYMVHYEARGALWQGKPVDPFSRDGKAEILIDVQNSRAGHDTLIICHFANEIEQENVIDLLTAATGIDLTENDLQTVGERAWNITRLFNIREGFTRADDDLPVRVKEEPLPDPGVKGRRITQADLDFMLDDYYQLRGWDKFGVPTEARLRALGIKARL